MELYEERIQQSGKAKANIRFIIDVIFLFRPGIVKSWGGRNNINSIAMFKNYFKISWRNLMKQKMYSTVKVGGFAIGVAACLLIAMFIKDELSYDTHYPAQLYRIIGVITKDGDLKKGVAFPAPMASALKNDFPEIEDAGRYNNSELFGAGGSEVRSADTEDNAFDDGFVYFDQELVNMLQLNFIYGNPAKALSEPNTIVITKRKADKYFPNENPEGKALIIKNQTEAPLTIGGVIEDFKTTSHLQFDFFIATAGLEFWKNEQKDWGASNYATYVRVAKGQTSKLLKPN